MSKGGKRAPRIPVEGSVVVYSGNEQLSCRLINVSKSGMALAADSERRPGTFVRLQFTLPEDDRPTDADAVVVRHRGAGDEIEWGVQLVDPSPELTHRLGKLQERELGVVVLPSDESWQPAETGIALPEDEEDPLLRRLRKLYQMTRYRTDD